MPPRARLRAARGRGAAQAATRDVVERRIRSPSLPLAFLPFRLAVRPELSQIESTRDGEFAVELPRPRRSPNLTTQGVQARTRARVELFLDFAGNRAGVEVDGPMLNDEVRRAEDSRED